MRGRLAFVPHAQRGGSLRALPLAGGAHLGRYLLGCYLLARVSLARDHMVWPQKLDNE